MLRRFIKSVVQRASRVLPDSGPASELEARVRHAERAVEALQQQLQESGDRLALQARSLAALAELQAAAQTGAAPAVPAGAARPLISVIMATRNRASVLPAAVRSVQAQTHADWELVIVDDGSDDGTSQVVAALAAEDPRIHSVRLPERAGVSRARNAAIAVARGDVIAYLDDDNEYYPTYLASVATAYARDPDLGCAYAGQVWVGAATQAEPARTMVTFDRFTWDGLSKQTVSIDLNVFSHRRSLSALLGGFDERLLKHSDWDLALRYTAQAAPLRIPVMAVRYDWGHSPRVGNTASSAAPLHHIREKYVRPDAGGLRVLVVAYSYPQLSESYVHSEIRWLLTRGVEVEVATLIEPTSRGEPLVPVHQGDVAGAIARFRPDVVHVHWISLAKRVAAELAAAGVPVTVRGHGFDHSGEGVAELLSQPWLARLYLFPLLQVSTGGGQHPKLARARAAVDASRYFPVPAKNRRLVVRAGACLPTKDLQLFVEVAALRPEYRFVLALSTNASGHETAEALVRLNAARGGPVEIVFDAQYDRMSELVREAGVYLHTFGFMQPFGQPVSIAEAMATGAVPVLRRAEASLDYGGEVALYYETAQEAASLLADMLDWDDAEWARRERQAVDFGYIRHADTVVFQPMLDDWLRIGGQRARGRQRPERSAAVEPVTGLEPATFSLRS